MSSGGFVALLGASRKLLRWSPAKLERWDDQGFKDRPAAAEQHHIVAQLRRIETTFQELDRNRLEVLQGLDALLPAILDRAFRGEL